MLNRNDIVKIVESAFKPFECTIEFENYYHKFSFRVEIPNQNSITLHELKTELQKNEHQLLSTILGIRSRIEAKGFDLDPWSFPKME